MAAPERKDWSSSTNTVEMPLELCLPKRRNVDSFSTSLRVDAAFSIPGWMYPFEVVWLAYEATLHHKIVELGCFLGRSTRALVDNTKGTVLAVDDFQGPRDYECTGREHILGHFMQNMMGCEDHLQVCRGDFSLVRPELHSPPFDMIFIDGDHRLEAVKRDIEKWEPFISKGGLISGHDYHSEYPSVMQAVDEAFEGRITVVPGTSIWMVENQ